MTDHTSNSLSALITSLTRIVGPAVDQDDPLAQQQLALTVGYLDFLKSRLPHLRARERTELDHHRRLADAVAKHVRPQSSDALEDLATKARAHLHDASADEAQLRDLTARIAALVTEEIRAADDDRAARLEQAVIDASRDRVELERSWYQPMGFDPNPITIRPIAELLSRSTG